MTETAVIDQQALTAKITALSAEFSQKMQEATMRGDFGAVQTLSEEMQKRMMEIQAEFLKPAAPKPTSLYDGSKCGVDLDLTVYDGERNTYLALTQDAGFMEIANRLLSGNPEANSRKHLLKRALRMTPKMAPLVHDILNECKAKLGLKMDLDVYVYQDTDFNASCYPSSQNSIYVLLTSSLLEKFTRDELTFVLGHEIGHALFNHHRLPIHYLLEHGRGHISPVQALRLYSWSRGCEVTADRMGLICGQNFEAAARSFFKLSSGVTEDRLAFDLQDYIKQFDDLSGELKNSKIDAEDMYSSHPFSPLRIKALEIFHRSQTYHTLIGQPGGEIPEASMEGEIRSFMSLVEPAALQQNPEIDRFVKPFLFMAGYLVAAANGKVEDEELQALASILDPITLTQGIQKVQNANAESIDQELNRLAEEINMHLAVVSKLNILRDICIVSYADGSVDDSEVETLYKLADKLHIRREFIDDVLNSATEEMK